MRVLSPVGERPAAAAHTRRRARVTGEVIGVIDDGLSGVFMPHLMATLKERAEPSQVIHWTKSNGGAPAPQEIIERLSRECQAVIVGVAL
jgi:hypothetical protein